MYFSRRSLFFLFSWCYAFVFCVPLALSRHVTDPVLESSDFAHLHRNSRDEISEEEATNGEGRLIFVHVEGDSLQENELSSENIKNSGEKHFTNSDEIFHYREVGFKDGNIFSNDFEESQVVSIVSNSSDEDPLVIALIPEAFEAPPVNLFSAGEELPLVPEESDDVSSVRLSSGSYDDNNINSASKKVEHLSENSVKSVTSKLTSIVPKDLIISEPVLRRSVRSNGENTPIIFGTCKPCHKILVRDTIIRCNNKGHVTTIISYDGIGCSGDEKITCVKLIDRSENGEGADVKVKSGAVGHPFIKLNITSHVDKGYHFFLEIRGLDPSKPDCT